MTRRRVALAGLAGVFVMLALAPAWAGVAARAFGPDPRTRHVPVALTLAESCADRAAAWARAQSEQAPGIPPSGSTVRVQHSATNSAQEFSFIRMGRGGCLARLDNDAGVTVTAIGLFPLSASVPPEAAYETALEKVTVRRAAALP